MYHINSYLYHSYAFNYSYIVLSLQNNLPAGFVGIYSPEQRRHRIERFEQVNDDIGAIESKSLRYCDCFLYTEEKEPSVDEEG